MIICQIWFDTKDVTGEEGVKYHVSPRNITCNRWNNMRYGMVAWYLDVCVDNAFDVKLSKARIEKNCQTDV